MATPYIPPGTRAAPTISDLARLGGFRREYVSAWRREGAPETLLIREWYEWFLRSGNPKYVRYARKLAPYLALTDGQPQDDTDAQDDGETAEEADARWKRLRADKAQRDLDLIDGKLVERALIVLIVSRFAALVAERLQSGIWDELVSAGLPADPEMQRRLRTAHDDAMVRVREDVTGDHMRTSIRDVLREQAVKRAAG